MSSKLQNTSSYWVKVAAHSLGLATLAALSQPLESKAQITPALDGTGSQVRINGNQIHIYGGSLSSDEANLFHSLQQFGLTEDQIANFIANPNLNNIVTRIIGGDPSVINGVIQVTGGDPNLYLMNPSGVIFGANAQLNLPSSFVATTANGIQFGHLWLSAAGMNNYENLVGNPTAFSFDANAGAIINAGNLAVNPQQSLLLLGGSVVNTGQLSAQEGQVLVTAIPERNVLHVQVPGNILTLEVEIPDELAAQPHAWTLPIASLPELLTSEAVAPESLGLAITDAGDVQLAGSNMQIPNQAGTAIVSGAIDVSGNQGGSVGVFGDLVGVADAQINASGALGGGTVLVGGEYRGQGTVPTAERAYIDENSTIAADALTSGDGGRVIVWADDATAFYGEITARGGVTSGNGGFAEVSGREYLVFDGMADLSGENGESGTLLLDPENIVISNVGSDSPGINPSRFHILQDDFLGQTITITQNTLQDLASQNTDIKLEARNNIAITSLNPGTPENQGDPIRPTLGFGLLINADGSVSNIYTGGTGNISFIADADRNGVGDFTMPEDAVIRMTSDRSTELQNYEPTRTLTIQGHNITLGEISTRSGIQFTTPADSRQGRPGGNVIVRASGDVITGDIFTFADSDPNNSNLFNGGDITITGIDFNNDMLVDDFPNTINTSRGILSAGSAQGSGGSVLLEAEGDITTAAIRTSSVGAGANAGNVNIVSYSGDIDISRVAEDVVNNVNATGIATGFTANQGGNVLINASSGRVITSGINTGTEGVGGSVDIKAGQNIVIQNSQQDNVLITSRSTNSLISGNVNITGDITSEQNSLEFDAGTNTIFLDGSVRTNNANIAFNSQLIVDRVEGVGFEAGMGNLIFNSGMNANNTPLLFVANNLNIAGNIQGSNTLIIQSVSQGINLGSNSGDSLDLTTTELGLISGFSNVTFDAGTNPITISSPITLNTPTQLLTTNSNVNIGANVTTLGQDLTFNSNVVLGNNVQLSTGSGSGNLVFLGSISSIDEAKDGADYGLTLEADTGQIHFLDTVSVRELSILSAQALLVETGITTNNTDLTFNIPVILTGGTATLSTQTDGAGDITFNNTLNSEANETNNLELTPGTGNVTFNGVVGTNNSQRLGDITLGRFDTLTNNSTIRAASLQQTSGTLGQTATLEGNINTTGNGVNLTTVGNITANNLSRTGGATTLVSRNGSINVTNVTVTSGDFLATANAGVTATTLNNQNGAVNLRSGAGDVQATDVTAAGDVTAIANTDVTASNINSTGGSITATANNGAVQVSNLTSNGDVNVTALGTIRSTNGITSNGDDISLSSPQSITTETLTSNGGDISLGNNGGATGSVQVTGDINASGAVNGGDVAIISEAAIDLPNTNINTSGRTGAGGDITLRSVDGGIAVNNLTATGRTGGGNVAVIASELEDLAITLSIGEIDTSASIGDGGDVLLDPFGNIQVSFINAQGGTNGTGGDVTAITTGGLFRATDSFIDQNGINASISAAGGAGEGSISIFHNGGDLFIPFFVAFDGVDISAANSSGTVGALTTGNPAVNEDNIIENRVFPGTFVQDRIGIFTSDRFTLALDNALPDAEPDDPQLENADEQPFWLDEYFTRRTEAYLGLGFNTDVKSLEEIQEDLRLIEDATGVKPALIYAVFEPEEVLQTIAEGGPGSPDDLVNQGWLQRFREMGSDRLQLVLVTSEGQPIFRRPNDEEANRRQVTGRPEEDDNPLTSTVQLLNEGIQHDIGMLNRGGESKPDRYLPHAQRLYDLMVLPLEEDLRKLEIQNLVFILDTGLRSTPMAAMSSMHDGNTYIIENYSVGLMPSFSITDTRYNDIRNSEVLAMGMSDFSQHPDFENRPLEAVPYETTIITQQLWESSLPEDKPLLEDNFTVARYIESQENYPSGIVHLATHAIFNTASPNESLIQFSDRELKFSEFDSLNLYKSPIDLLVLSACKTAFDAENDNAELGFAGLAIQAGVKSALASIWEVSDIGTFALMLEFYTQLDQHTTKAAALQKAQRAMRKGKVYFENNTVNWTDNVEMVNLDLPQNTDLRHPYYWAGFTLVGNPW